MREKTPILSFASGICLLVLHYPGLPGIRLTHGQSNGILLAGALLLLLGVTSAWQRGRRKERELFRACRGQCIRCGYDMVFNASGVCPECGTATGVTVMNDNQTDSRLTLIYARSSRLFSIASVVSLLLCVGLVLLWGWSYRTSARVTYCFEKDASQYELSAKSCAGWLVLSRYIGSSQPIGFEASVIPIDGSVGWPVIDQDGSWFAGFGFYHHESGHAPHTASLTMTALPCWSLCLGLLALPIGREVKRRRRSKQHVSKLCEWCQYNLTGNTSGDCPECGTAVAKKPEAAR